MSARQLVLAEIDAERERQEAKWGPQPVALARPSDILLTLADEAKRQCDMALENDRCSHRLIIAEEAAEAYFAMAALASAMRNPVYADPAVLAEWKARTTLFDDARKELIQLAACCVKAIEQIDDGRAFR